MRVSRGVASSETSVHEEDQNPGDERPERVDRNIRGPEGRARGGSLSSESDTRDPDEQAETDGLRERYQRQLRPAGSPIPDAHEIRAVRVESERLVHNSFELEEAVGAQ